MTEELATILFGVKKDWKVKIGMPPRDRMDNFNTRALDCGKLENVSHVFCSPDGTLYCVRDGDLFTGPLPSSNNANWFSSAKRIGRAEWSRFKLIFFSPTGNLYAVTKEGDLYKGPVPEYENVSWLYDKATEIGQGGWNDFHALFFDPEGSLYGVTNNNFFVKGPEPENVPHWLIKNTKTIGKNNWCKYAHFIAIHPDGKLWCVDKENGNIYRGTPPDSKNARFVEYADHLGWGYQEYKCLCFTKDKTVHNIINFTFLPENAKRTSETPEVIAEKIYDNRDSSTKLNHEFTFSKTVKQSSSFEHEKSFTLDIGMEISFEASIPFVGSLDTTVSMNTSATRTWNFSETNEKEVTYSASTPVEVEPGKAIKITASIVSSQMNVPYEAQALTMFGRRTTIRGVWCGVSHYNLMVKQTDYNG